MDNFTSDNLCSPLSIREHWIILKLTNFLFVILQTENLPCILLTLKSYFEYYLMNKYQVWTKYFLYFILLRFMMNSQYLHHWSWISFFITSSGIFLLGKCKNFSQTPSEFQNLNVFAIFESWDGTDKKKEKTTCITSQSINLKLAQLLSDYRLTGSKPVIGW